MDTKLKKGKKIRAFIYRIFGVGFLFLFVASAILGWDALVTFFYEENTSVLYGDVCDLPAFQDFTAGIFNDALIAFAGAVDDRGKPLPEDVSAGIAREAERRFIENIHGEAGDLVYYIWTPEQEYSNVSYPFFSEYDRRLILPQNVKPLYCWDGETSTLSAIGNYSTGQYLPDNDNKQNISVVIALKTNTAYKGKFTLWASRTASAYRVFLILFFVSGFFTLLFALLSLVSRKAAKAAKVSYAGFTEKILLEVKLLLAGVLCYIAYQCLYDPNLFESDYYAWALERVWLFFPIGCLLYFFYTDIRKNGLKVLECSLPVKLYRLIKEFLLSKPWYRRALALRTVVLTGGIISSISGVVLTWFSLYGIHLFWISRATSRTGALKSLLTFCTVLGILLLITGILLLFSYLPLRRFFVDTKALSEKLSAVQLGKPGVPLILPASSPLSKAAADLNSLESGIEAAVEQKNRSNKMRVELITNVSHDLKTPLTSIINYADLLCEEELSPTASGYALALRTKAYRLKDMVQELFELSKATSGNLPVEKHPLDLVRLIRQTLADMDERISQSTLTFKTSFTEEPIMIEADGDKLYRVFQNLFVNAIQYSLEHSRVHVQLSAENGSACVKVKNTSRSELDFDTEDIIERFARADASRTTEGSGLGLSIVQSFTEACGGTFSIETDADMFTACVRFPLTSAQPDTGLSADTCVTADTGAVADICPVAGADTTPETPAAVAASAGEATDASET